MSLKIALCSSWKFVCGSCITVSILNIPNLFRDRRIAVLTVYYRRGLCLNHRMVQYPSGSNTSSVPILTFKSFSILTYFGRLWVRIHIQWLSTFTGYVSYQWMYARNTLGYTLWRHFTTALSYCKHCGWRTERSTLIKFVAMVKVAVCLCICVLQTLSFVGMILCELISCRNYNYTSFFVWTTSDTRLGDGKIEFYKALTLLLIMSGLLGM